MARLAWMTIALVFLADQLSKWVIFDRLLREGEPVHLLPFFSLTPVLNKGISFGLFPANSDLHHYGLVALALIIVAVLVNWLHRAKESLTIIGLGLVIGGAAGNVLDRMRLGAVRDFFDFYIGTWHWPAFNIADAAIVIGMGLLLIDSWLAARQGSKLDVTSN